MCRNSKRHGWMKCWQIKERATQCVWLSEGESENKTPNNEYWPPLPSSPPTKPLNIRRAKFIVGYIICYAFQDNLLKLFHDNCFYLEMKRKKKKTPATEFYSFAQINKIVWRSFLFGSILRLVAVINCYCNKLVSTISPSNRWNTPQWTVLGCDSEA